MSAIDHKALAEEQLDFITDEYTREPHIHANVIEYTGIAQAHATLALAEQQRIANLIAFGNAKRADIIAIDSDDELFTWLHEGNGVEGYLGAVERKGLGL